MENKHNFKGLSSFTQTFNDEKTCREFLENLRWDGQPICPHCNYREKIYRFKDGRTYKCAKCKRNFTITVASVFQNSRIPLRKWFIAIYLFSANKTGVSSHQMARYLEITQTNAWYMLHKIRKVMSESEQFKERLKGIIECDETYVGGKNKNRHWDKKYKYSQGRSVVDKTPVFGILQRNGKVVVWTLTNLNGKRMRAMIRTKVEKGSIICTDEYRVYHGLNRYYEHYIIDHSKGKHKEGEFYHTNNIENFWNFIKRAIMGTYRKVDKIYLNRYAREAAYRYNTRKLKDKDRFAELLVDFFDSKSTREQIRLRH